MKRYEILQFPDQPLEPRQIAPAHPEPRRATTTRSDTAGLPPKVVWGVLVGVVLLIGSIPRIVEVLRLKAGYSHSSRLGSSPAEWFEGGTLHHATMGEWRRASSKNKLATAADFVSSMMRGRAYSVADLRPLAAQLVQGLDAFISGPADTYRDQQPVAQVAAMILAGSPAAPR